MLTYLLLSELSHGKLLNFRPPLVEHEFVNAHQGLADRTSFRVEQWNWREHNPAAGSLRTWFVALLRDVGTGLDRQLYEAALAHFLRERYSPFQRVEITTNGCPLGWQRVPLLWGEFALQVTVFQNRELLDVGQHLRRFLEHTTLRGCHWINVNNACVQFATLLRGR